MDTQPIADTALSRFNALPPDEAGDVLAACCASRTWISRLEAGRPYASRADVLDAAELTCRQLDDADIEEALAAHPRIGDRATGTSTEAGWSRQEQASVSDADTATRAELHAANVAYEERFGRVFLIRAAGRSPAEMLAEAKRRLANDPATEQAEVARELGQIARLRVEKLLAS